MFIGASTNVHNFTVFGMGVDALKLVFGGVFDEIVALVEHVLVEVFCLLIVALFVLLFFRRGS